MNEKKVSKFVGLGVFVLCVAFSLLFTAFRTHASGDAVVYEQCEKGEDTPTKEGYLFGGWYKDGNDSDENIVREPETGETYYAKFVPEEVLGIKAQVSNTLLTGESAETAAVRFATTVDSLRYREVGFLIRKGDRAETRGTVTNVVYTNLYQVTNAAGAVDGTSVEPAAPTIFNAASMYFKTYTIFNIPADAYNTDITVTPYWITLDGTMVKGIKSIKTVNLGRSWFYVNATANVDTEEYGTYNHP